MRRSLLSSPLRSAWIAAVVWLGLIWLLSFWYYWPSLGWPATVHTGAGGGRPAGAGVKEPGDAVKILAAVGRVATPRDAGRWFTEQWYHGASDYYRPVTLASTWFDHAVWGERALGYRLHNFVLHVVNAILLGLVVMGVARSFWPGAAASLLLVLSGTASAVTTWVAGRGDLLAAFFFLLTLLLLLAIRPQERRRYLWPLAVVAFLLALGSKEIAVALPPLVTVWVFLWPTPLSRGRRALIALSLWVALGAFWVARTHALGTATSTALDLKQLLQPVAAVNYARFLAPPAARLLWQSPWIGWLSFLTPQFWTFLAYQVIYWGCALLLLATVPGPTIAFFAWKAITVPPIMGSLHFFAWKHYWYLPHMGSAALTGLAVWRVPVALAGWWRRTQSRGAKAHGEETGDEVAGG